MTLFQAGKLIMQNSLQNVSQYSGYVNNDFEGYKEPHVRFSLQRPYFRCTRSNLEMVITSIEVQDLTFFLRYCGYPFEGRRESN